MEGQMGPPTVEILIKMREKKEGECYVAVIAEDIASCHHGVSVAGRNIWLVCEDDLHANHVSSLEYTEYTRAGRWTKLLLPTATKGLLMH
jgi:hypothetical protein